MKKCLQGCRSSLAVNLSLGQFDAVGNESPDQDHLSGSARFTT